MSDPIDPNAGFTYWPPEVVEPPVPFDHRRRNLLITVLVTLVTAAAVVGGYLVFTVGQDSAAGRLAIPESFDGYVRLTNGNASNVEGSMRSVFSGMAGGMRTVFDAATIGVYAKNSGDTPRLIVLTIPTSAMPAGAQGSAGQFTQGVQAMLGPSTRSFPAGPHGGTSECGTLPFTAIDEIVCAWADPVNVGVMVSVITPMTPVRLSRIEVDFRDRLR